MDNSTRRRWHNMLVAALSDKKLDPEEQGYLEKMRIELGITQDEANSIVESYKEKRGNIELAGSKDEKTTILRDIIGVMLVDGVVDDKEKKLVAAVARHIGLADAEVEKIIQQ